MKKQSYVPTSLGQYLNENRAITLTRKYGEKEPVVVGSRAPLRNQVLNYVAENQKVSRTSLKRFIAGLNETSKNPNAAANMWLKRNSRFFIAEEKGGVTTLKLSKLGMKLLERTSAISEASLNEEKEMKSRVKKDHDFIDKKTGDKGVTSEEDDKVDESEKTEQTREERIKAILEQIRAKRAQRLNEEDEDKEDEEGEEPAEDVETPDEESEEEKEEEVEGEEAEEEMEGPEEDEESEEVEDDDRVEITEFIITVDDADEAIAELAELGVDAEVSDEEMAGDDIMDAPEGEDDFGDEDLGGEELPDFDLDLGGELEGEGAPEEGAEELEVSGEEMEESVTGMEREEKAMTPNLVEDEDELQMDDLEGMEGPEGEEEVDVEATEELPDEGEEDMLDLPAEGGEEVAAGEQQIKVSAENWEQLKGWLEGKGVDIEEMFGGEIEVEGEEDVEDEISFDGLEDVEDEDESPEHEAEESEEEEAEEEAEGDDDEEVEESVTGMEKEEKAGTPNLTK